MHSATLAIIWLAALAAAQPAATAFDQRASVVNATAVRLEFIATGGGSLVSAVTAHTRLNNEAQLDSPMTLQADKWTLELAARAGDTLVYAFSYVSSADPAPVATRIFVFHVPADGSARDEQRPAATPLKPWQHAAQAAATELEATVIRQHSPTAPPSAFEFPLPLPRGAAAGASSQCNTTRAGAMMQHALSLVIAESPTKQGSSEPCALAGSGPGIYTPPGAARAYKAVATAMFNAWTRFDERAVPTVAQADWTRHAAADRTESAKENALTVAAYTMLAALLPQGVQRAQLAAQLQAAWGVSVTAPTEPTARAAQRDAALLAETLLRDGMNQANCYADISAYSPTNDAFVLDSAFTMARTAPRDELCWAPLLKTGFITRAQAYVTPQAGTARPFGMPSSTTCLPPPPPTGAALESEHKDLLDFARRLEDDGGRGKAWWAGSAGTSLPPGAWQEIALQTAARACYSLDSTVKLLFVVANSVMDGAVAAWAAKRVFNSARPAVFIPTRFFAQPFARQYAGPYCPARDIRGFEWRPYQMPRVITPPFPGYVSGHSSMSFAAAEALRVMTGSDSIPGGPLHAVVRAGASAFEPSCSRNNRTVDGLPCVFTECEVDRNFNSENNWWPKRDITLSWSRFSEAAGEAGASRLWGGIHIQSDNREGARTGTCAARFALARAQQHITGTPAAAPLFFEDVLALNV